MSDTKPLGTDAADASISAQWSQAMLKAWQSQTPKPAGVYPDTTMLEAYAAQRAYINTRSSAIAGYKAALTSTSAQKVFAIDHPIAGVIFADDQIDNGTVVSKTNLLSPLIETEIGFTIGQDITTTVTASDVSALLLNWLPMVEIADAAFTSRPGLGDIVASNALAACYLKPQQHFETNTAAEVSVKLFHNNKLLHEGLANEAMGNPLESAAWLINHTLAQGHSIQAGQLLMTGSLGAAHPAKPGDYRAEYKGLGGLELSTLEFSFPSIDNAENPE